MRLVPPIRPVRSGKILDTNLINHMIQRTEYGAELLARYKMVAGTNMFVEQAENGLGISYLTALAGGAGNPVGSGSAGTGSGGAGTGTGGAGTGSGGSGTPQPVVFIPYKILYGYDGKTFVYDGVNSTQLPTTATNLENNSTLTYSGISGNNVYGNKFKNIAVFDVFGGFLGNINVPSGFIYDGSTIKEVYIPHTSSFGIRYMDGGIVVGEYNRLYGAEFDGVPFGIFPIDGSDLHPAFVYNGSSYQKITIFRNIIDPSGREDRVRYNYGMGVSGNNVAVGLTYFGRPQNTFSDTALYSNGGVSILTPPDSVWGSFPVPGGISGTKMLIRSRPSGAFDDETIWLYSGGSYTKILFPSSIRTSTTAFIKGNLIAGIYIKTGNVTGGFVYDGSTYTELLYSDLKLFPRGIKDGHILLANIGASRWFDYYNGNYTEITVPNLGATLIAMG